ncbi:MAG: LysM peptidoglycan-binding domain-containing protein [Candidatus Melainabacteria bacterium]|nr:LysM peptidoglycan-binding domain-containing protein [Candidatus Melainabacteria bacterium]
MAETTQLNKVRQKHLKGLANGTKSTEEKPVSSYFYPKNNLYTRQEFELLDTIYSDEPPTITEEKVDTVLVENFWPQNKEEYLNIPKQKNNLFNNLTWFLAGVMLTSVVWLIYFQLKVHEIRTKGDTQIVFQKSAAIVTDKTVDKEVAKKLGQNEGATQVENQDSTTEAVSTKQESVVTVKNTSSNKFKFSSWFSPKVKKEVVIINNPLPVKYHIIGSGDSLWTIANKYYSNPSPENINKIMKANNMKRVGTLLVGQKIAIP